MITYLALLKVHAYLYFIILKFGAINAVDWLNSDEFRLIFARLLFHIFMFNSLLSWARNVIVFEQRSQCNKTLRLTFEDFLKVIDGGRARQRTEAG